MTNLIVILDSWFNLFLLLFVLAFVISTTVSF